MNRKPPVIGIALGDPQGIGPEIAVKALAQQAADDAHCVLVGDAWLIQQEARKYAPDLSCQVYQAGMPRTPGVLPYVPVAGLQEQAWQPGKVSAAAGAAAVEYVSQALRLAQSGVFDAVVGAPHNEQAIHEAGIPFNGYPGLVARMNGLEESQVFLMLVSPELKIGHVTLHESVSQALQRLTPELVVEAARAVIAATQRMGVARPRLGVFGINPHASEGGLFGSEDARITYPAVQQLQTEGYEVSTPMGGDVLLANRAHDVYLAMFHDQGHIPMKLISPRSACALSVGAPQLFSSVGHGSSHDIAGQGKADPSALIRAINNLAKGQQA